MKNSLKPLQNGSDIRGIAQKGMQNEPVNLTDEVTAKIAAAFIEWLSRDTGKNPAALSIAIGRDSRLSGPSLLKSFASAASSTACKVFNCNLSTTPAMFMSTQFDTMKCDGAVMITASHLPFNRNGFKFFTSKGGLNKGDITKILELAEKYEPAVKFNDNYIRAYDLLREYSNFLVEKILDKSENLKPLDGLHIIVDAGNGAGGFFAESILKPLGADITGSLFLEPDGHFPNHIPNPEDDDAIRILQAQVIKTHADLGIIFDTDVDRSALVNSKGKAINRNRLIALLASIILEEYPKSHIVTDSVTSDGLTDFIKAHNGIHHRFKRGYKNVINEGQRLNREGNDCWLAIETSGHAAFRENYFLDDGAFLIAKVLIRASELRKKNKTIDDLISGLKEPYESKEYRIKIKDPEFKSYGTNVIEKLEDYVSTFAEWRVVPDNFEGIRIKCSPKAGDGWFLLRLSLHDPVLPLNIESESENGVLFIINKLKPFFNQFRALDIAALY